MTQVAHAIGVCKLPDQGVVLSHDASRTGLDAVRAVDVVRTLDAAVWSLSRSRTTSLYMCLSLSKLNLLLKILIVKTAK